TDSDRKPGHERLFAEPKERLIVKTSQACEVGCIGNLDCSLKRSEKPVVDPSLGLAGSPSVVFMSPGTDVKVVRDMEGGKEETLLDDRTLRGVRSWVLEDGTLGSGRTFNGYKILDGGTPFETNETPWDEEDKEERQNPLGSQPVLLKGNRLETAILFSPTNWDIGRLDLVAHPLGLDVYSLDSNRRNRAPVVDEPDVGLEWSTELQLVNGILHQDVEGGYGKTWILVTVSIYGISNVQPYWMPYYDAHSDVDGHQNLGQSHILDGQPELDERSIHDESSGHDRLTNSYPVTHESRFDSGKYLGSERELFDEYFLGDKPTEDCTVLVEGHVITSARDKFTGDRGDAHDHARSRRSQKARSGMRRSFVEAALKKMVHAEAVLALSVMFESPRVEPAPLTSDSPGSPVEQAHKRTSDLQ
ncbi:hypothetical protein FRC09_013371, partial [Ceratobasidium sp. 395]